MIQVTFITGNQKKVMSAQEAIKGYDVELLQEKLETPEIQDKSIQKVAEFSARYAADKLNKPVVKVDVGFEIEALNGFPGPFSKFINEWLKPKQILLLLDGEDNRKAKFIDVVAYCEPGNDPVSFSIETNGEIDTEAHGENGWGIDQIFIPDGYKVSLASLEDQERVKVWGKDHWINLARYLSEKKGA